MRGSISQTVKQLGAGLAALGVRVEKPSAAKPDTGTDDLFIVRGGKILLTSLIGQVTVEITNVGVDNMTLQHTPTTGAATAVDLCLLLDIGGDIVDTIYIITGAVGAAVTDDAGVGVWMGSMQTNLLILQPGTIAVACTSDETGSIKWLLHYIAVDTNAYVVPAP